MDKATKGGVQAGEILSTLVSRPDLDIVRSHMSLAAPADPDALTAELALGDRPDERRLVALLSRIPAGWSAEVASDGTYTAAVFANDEVPDERLVVRLEEGQVASCSVIQGRQVLDTTMCAIEQRVWRRSITPCLAEVTTVLG